MTTPVIHVLGAFLVIIFIARILKHEIAIEHLFLLSLGALLPDLIDKLITGGRYPLHSILVSGILLLIVNTSLRYYTKTHPILVEKYPLINSYILLMSVAILTHPLMDLEGLVPLLYPLDMMGYKLEFIFSIRQALPPIITNFRFELITEPYNFSASGHEGDLFSTLDILFIIMFVISGLITTLSLFLRYFFNSSKEKKVNDL